MADQTPDADYILKAMVAVAASDGTYNGDIRISWTPSGSPGVSTEIQRANDSTFSSGLVTRSSAASRRRPRWLFSSEARSTPDIAPRRRNGSSSRNRQPS